MLVGFLCYGCDKNSDPKERIIDMIDYTEELTNWNWEKMEYDKLYVFRSIEQYTQYQKEEDSPLPEIDFNKKTLLVTKGKTNTGISEIEKKIIATDAEDYILYVKVTLNETLSISEYHIGILVSSIPANKEIELKTLLIE